MINANELRIGNWVYLMGIDFIEDNPIVDKDDKTPTIVDLSVLNAIENHNGSINMPIFNPIPLTPEILEKAGFKMVGERPYYSMRISINSADELCWYSQDEQLRYQTKGSGFTRYYETKYLHQLQNLYFALTGQELEIKL